MFSLRANWSRIGVSGVSTIFMSSKTSSLLSKEVTLKFLRIWANIIFICIIANALPKNKKEKRKSFCWKANVQKFPKYLNVNRYKKKKSLLCNSTIQYSFFAFFYSIIMTPLIECVCFMFHIMLPSFTLMAPSARKIRRGC